MHFSPTMGLVCMTQEPCGSPKDTSNADSGKIGSVLTLGVNCSTGKVGRGPCCKREAEREKRDDVGKAKVDGREGRMKGHTLIERPLRCATPRYEWGEGVRGGMMEGVVEQGGREAIWQQHKCIKL